MSFAVVLGSLSRLPSKAVQSAVFHEKCCSSFRETSLGQRMGSLADPDPHLLTHVTKGEHACQDSLMMTLCESERTNCHAETSRIITEAHLPWRARITLMQNNLDLLTFQAGRQSECSSLPVRRTNCPTGAFCFSNKHRNGSIGKVSQMQKRSKRNLEFQLA